MFFVIVKVTSFQSTGCELSTEACSKNVYSIGPRSFLVACLKEKSSVMTAWHTERLTPLITHGLPAA